ncbi:hypothetical protein jhhlp_000585 [Lomentospora prolificans]|uniref:Uncharacterized protein n=1 Tax=Lomentospora prolificans TaxID=41688 RepID=A0A2N3NIY3_9PEZI|nr:hypothetical protein jhhlp_000585 [Lomentospora prolificans]
MAEMESHGPAGVRSQWAEFDPNTAPQVSIGTDLELAPPAPVTTTSQPDKCDGGRRVTWGWKDSWTMLRCQSRPLYISICGVVCVLIVVGISVPLVDSRIKASTALETGDLPVTRTAGPSQFRTTSNSQYSTEVRNPEPMSNDNMLNISHQQAPGLSSCRKTDFLSDTSWVGIRDGNEWDFELTAVGSAEKCCTHCYRVAHECNAWLFVPSTAPGPDCTVIVGYQGEDPDDECPNGRPEILFKKVGNKRKNFAGSGPCSSFK